MEFDIRYEQENTILKSVPAIQTITILRTAKQIFGKSENDNAFVLAQSTLKSVSFESDPQLEHICPYAFYSCTELSGIDLSMCTKLTTIDVGSFNSCSKLSKITFPESLKKFGENALSYSGLKSVFIPKNVEMMDRLFLAYCTKLESITFDPEIKIKQSGDHMFIECIITNITIPKFMPYVAPDTFEKCYNMVNIFVQDGHPSLKSVGGVLMSTDETQLVIMPPEKTDDYKIPDTVTRVHSFRSSLIQHVTFSTKITEIKPWAFFLSKISELILPTSIRTIGSNAFNRCKNLVSITLPTGLETIGSSCFAFCSNLKTVIIPETLTSLGGGAFNNCHSTLKISFDEKSDFLIDDQFFITDKSSTALSQYIGDNTSLTIPDSIITIQEEAFISSRIQKIVFGPKSKLTCIEKRCFQGSLKLTTINLPDTLEQIGEKAFSNCSMLESIEFGSNLNLLELHAFRQCSNLHSVVFNNSPLTIIDEEAFLDCISLTTVTFAGELRTIKKKAFKNCYSLSKVDFPGKVETLELEAFYHTGIKSCTFDPLSPLTTFTSHLFYNCTNLATIVYPTSLQTIGLKALAYTKISSIILPNSVVKLDDHCFLGCTDLVDFHIQSESLLETINYGVFSQCSSFKKIINDSPNFIVDQDALYDIGKTKLYVLPQSSPRKYFSFPETLITINAGALLECKNIKMIFIPESTEEIGQSAFQGCVSLKSINIPSNIRSVGVNAFSGCKGLTCDISIENTSTEFIQMLKDAKMPNRCFYPCDANTCDFPRYSLPMLLFTSVVLLFISN